MSGSVRIKTVTSQFKGPIRRDPLVLRLWVFGFSRLTGLWPFDDDGRFRKSAFVRGTFLISTPILICCYTRTASFRRVLGRAQKDPGFILTQHILGFFIEAAMFLVCMLHAVTVFRERDSFKRAITYLSCAKIQIRSSNPFFVATLSAQTLTCIVSYVTFQVLNNWVSIVGSINVVIVCTINYICILQFYTISEGLSFIMKSETASLKRKVNMASSTASFEMGRVTNTLYQKQMLLTFIQLFGYFVTYFYNLIMGVLKSEVNLEYGLFLSMSISVRFCMLMLIASCSESLRTQAEAFNTELFNLMRNNSELCKNKKLRLYLSMKQTVNFTACGFFDLGYPLVTSIIAAATTYLVILIQFSM